MPATNTVGGFLKIEDPSVLIPLLEKRLPKSCLVYNSAKIYPRLPKPHKCSFYSLYGDIDETAWIIYHHYREDYGNDYLFSADEENSKISKQEAIQIFANTKVIEWDKPYFMPGMEKWISEMMFEISVNLKGNISEVHPCLMYYKDRAECLNLESKIEDSKNVEIKRLDPELGLKFILDTWKYTTKNTDIVIRKVLSLNESGGIYVDGKPVCGVITHGFGPLSALYTLKEYRNKGYAKICMKFVYKEQAKNQLVPVSIVEVRNAPSITFHEKLGCKLVCHVDSMFSLNHDFL